MIKVTGHLPLSSGNGVSSTSPPVLYLDDPWLFLCFFFSDLLAKGSIRSTNVPPEDILSAFFYLHKSSKVCRRFVKSFVVGLVNVIIAVLNLRCFFFFTFDTKGSLECGHNTHGQRQRRQKIEVNEFVSLSKIISRTKTKNKKKLIKLISVKIWLSRDENAVLLQMIQNVFLSSSHSIPFLLFF